LTAPDRGHGYDHARRGRRSPPPNQADTDGIRRLTPSVLGCPFTLERMIRDDARLDPIREDQRFKDLLRLTGHEVNPSS